MSDQFAESLQFKLLAGLTWEAAGQDCWRAEDRFAQYTVFRNIDRRWYGYWHHNGQKINAEWSCPTLETFAEYMVDNARRKLAFS